MYEFMTMDVFREHVLSCLVMQDYDTLWKVNREIRKTVEDHLEFIHKLKNFNEHPIFREGKNNMDHFVAKCEELLKPMTDFRKRFIHASLPCLLPAFFGLDWRLYKNRINKTLNLSHTKLHVFAECNSLMERNTILEAMIISICLIATENMMKWMDLIVFSKDFSINDAHLIKIMSNRSFYGYWFALYNGKLQLMSDRISTDNRGNTVKIFFDTIVPDAVYRRSRFPRYLEEGVASITIGERNRYPFLEKDAFFVN